MVPRQEHNVCKPVKPLYGLKQAPKQWYEKFDSTLTSNSFHINDSNACIYSNFDKLVVLSFFYMWMIYFSLVQTRMLLTLLSPFLVHVLT